MGISFGEPFRCGAFALANVSHDLQKRNMRPLLHNKILYIFTVGCVVAIQRLAVGDSVSRRWGFQQHGSGLSDFGGALAVGQIILALNTLGSKTSSVTRVLAPQTGQQGFAVGCPISTIPMLWPKSLGAGASSSCAASSLVFRFRKAISSKCRIL